VMAGYSMRKQDLDARLARIEGQVRGIRRMLAEDTYCIDVLTQLSSVTGAIRAVGLGLLDDHVRHCVRDSLVQGHGEDKVTELVAAVERFATR
jgi:DNA-binding FrmR family transcriptional regulator